MEVRALFGGSAEGVQEIELHAWLPEGTGRPQARGSGKI